MQQEYVQVLGRREIPSLPSRHVTAGCRCTTFRCPCRRRRGACVCVCVRWTPAGAHSIAYVFTTCVSLKARRSSSIPLCIYAASRALFFASALSFSFSFGSRAQRLCAGFFSPSLVMRWRGDVRSSGMVKGKKTLSAGRFATDWACLLGQCRSNISRGKVVGRRKKGPLSVSLSLSPHHLMDVGEEGWDI